MNLLMMELFPTDLFPSNTILIFLGLGKFCIMEFSNIQIIKLRNISYWSYKPKIIKLLSNTAFWFQLYPSFLNFYMCIFQDIENILYTESSSSNEKHSSLHKNTTLSRANQSCFVFIFSSYIKFIVFSLLIYAPSKKWCEI